MKFIKEVLLFLIFFSIFYSEPLEIFGIKFAVIWKLFLFAYLIIYFKKIFKVADKISKYGFLYSLKNFFNFSVLVYPIQNLYHTLVIFNFPFIYNIVRNNLRETTILNSIKRLSLFIILSAIPFHFHFIEPLGKGYDLDLFNTDATGYVGIFQNAHAASIITSIAVINLFFFYMKDKKVYFFVIAFFGILNVYYTYVRTGYIMLVIGLVSLITIKTKFFEKLRFIAFGSLIVLIFFSFINTELLLNRFFNIYKNNPTKTVINLDVEKISSGRTLFWAINLNQWWESSTLIKILGYGEEIAKDNMEKLLGYRLFSHNGFIDAFIQNGIIGLFLYLGIFYFIIKLIITNKYSKYYKLCLSSTILLILMNIFQGGYFFLFEILLSLNLSLLNNKEIKNT